MKKIKLFIILIIFPIITVNAADLDTIFKETEFAYYRNSTNAQYNSARNEYYDPAEATVQDMKYSVCSRYTSNVYKNAFNISIPGNTNALMKFVDANYKDSKYKKYIIDYHDCVSNAQGSGSCTTMTAANYNKLIGSLKPGDVLVYTSGDIKTGSGHALIIYDTFVNSAGNNDAYILNSTGGGTIQSRLIGTNRLYYNYRVNSNSDINNNKVNKSVKEGTIKMETFRTDARFAFTNSKQSYGFKGTTKYRVAILRFIIDNKYPTYSTSDYKVTAEKDLTVTSSNGYLRTKYKDLTIAKTVSSNDNDVVELGETLTYTIKITNNGSTNYGKFYIQETVTNSKFTSIIEAPNGTIDGNKITYEISSLNANSTKTLTYKVKVTEDKNYLNNVVTTTGKFSNTNDFKLYLTTGTTKNTIDNKLSNEDKEKLKQSYNDLKSSKKGLDLINETYKEALNFDLDLTNFDITKLINQDATEIASCKSKGTSAKGCKNSIDLKNYKIGSTDYTYNDMIFNNYWNYLINEDMTANDPSVDYNSSKTQKQKNFLNWGGSTEAAKRAKTIVAENFEDGDILIYYNDNDYLLSNSANNKNSEESGLYAYIYLNGSFVGVNNTGTKKRNYFTKKYYTDNPSLGWYTLQNETDIPTGVLDFLNYQTLYNKYYYVILRPSLSEEMVAGVKAEFGGSDLGDDPVDDTKDGEDPADDDEPTDDKIPEDPTDLEGAKALEEEKKENPKTGAFISISLLVVSTVIGLVIIIISKKNEVLHRI